MARDIAGEIYKMNAERDFRKGTVVSFSEVVGSASGTSSPITGTLLNYAKIYRQNFTNETQVTATHNFRAVPFVFVLAYTSPYGVAKYGKGKYSYETAYSDVPTSDFRVGYSTTACIVNFNTSKTGQIVCFG